jgi:hypothetical protein
MFVGNKAPAPTARIGGYCLWTCSHSDSQSEHFGKPLRLVAVEHLGEHVYPKHVAVWGIDAMRLALAQMFRNQPCHVT